MIRPGRSMIDSTHTRALREEISRKIKSEMRSFLGLCNVYKRFFEKFPHVAAPLNSFLTKISPEVLSLDESQIISFQSLIEKICNPPVLDFPVNGLPFSVDTDDSNYQVGFALFQTYQDGERRPIRFFSRSLNKAEINYSAPERDCLEVLCSLLTLRPYLMYERFTVHSDQNSLN